MIYDVHTHFWQPHELGPQVEADAIRAGGVSIDHGMTSESHLEATKAADKCIVFGLRAKKTGYNIPNDSVKAQVDKAPERLVFFTSVDPSENNFMEELERTHQDMGAKGIKLGPIYQGVHPLDERYRRIYAYAQRHGLPILTHMATTFASGVPLEYANPVHMSQVAIDYPELNIILAHMGHPWIGETVAAIRKEPNLYADISALYYRPWQFYNALMLLVEYGTWKKVFFGSDYPCASVADSIKGLLNANHIVEKTGLPKISREILESILNRDAFTILGIE
ncbi:amidohydrolase family protein [bacterium]|nr:amidohydrolase family protein [bacterium]